MPSPAPRRSGCALASGLFFIVLGALLLAQNLTELQLLDYADEAFGLFARYWPLALIVWGAYKVYQRFSSPERSRVSALEVLALVLLVAFGLAVGAARDALDRLRSSELGSELASVLGPDVLGPTHRFRDEASLELDAGTPLVVENRFGALRVVGSERSDVRVVLDKRVHRPSEGEAKDVAARLHVELVGGTARVVGEDLGAVEADLELQLPRATPLIARVHRARVTVLGLDAPVEIEAEDADVAAERLGATLTVKTVDGDVRLDRVRGDVNVESRHGSIWARRLGGGLHAATERGAITAEDVAGALVLANRYGSIRVQRVRGSVAIDAAHTSVEVENASETVSVRSGDRPIFIRDVGGSLHVEARNAPVEARGVGGSVNIDARLQPVLVVDVAGTLTVRSSNGAVIAESLSAPADIEATSEDVRVSRFASSLSTRAEHGSIFADTDALGGNLALRTTYGNIELALPPSASVRVEARNREGELESDLAAIRLTESVEEGVRVFRGESEGARYEVRLDTDYGDIHLQGKGR